jgi:hypothetical protein
VKWHLNTCSGDAAIVAKNGRYGRESFEQVVEKALCPHEQARLPVKTKCHRRAISIGETDHLEPPAPIRLLGATGNIAGGPHDIARAWSRAFWGHPSEPDRIEYRCRHDDDQLAVALYDRDPDVVQRLQTRGLRDDPAWFGAVLHRYEVDLDE